MKAITDLLRDGASRSLRSGMTEEQELHSRCVIASEWLAMAPSNLARLNQEIASLQRELRDIEAQSQSLTREIAEFKSRITALTAETAATNTMPDVVEVRAEQTAIARAENQIQLARKAGRLLFNLASVQGSDVPADLRQLFSQQ